MAVVPIRKARSEPRRVVPGNTAGMVLLSKQDFDDLRSHAGVPTSNDLPRPLPMCGAAMGGSRSAGSTPAQGSMPSGGGGSSGSAQPRRTTPKVERRVRSANGRPPPAKAVLLSQSSGPSMTAPEVGAIRRQVVDVAVVKRAERESSERRGSRQKTPPPKFQKPPNGSFAAALIGGLGGGLITNGGGPLPGGGAGFPPGPGFGQKASRALSMERSRSESRGPASCPPPATIAGMLGGELGVCGIDPRRLPRPGQANAPAPAVLANLKPGAAQASEGKPVATLACFSLGGLQVSGLAAPVNTAPAAEVPDEFAWQAGDDCWSSSEEEDGKNDFDYREYRYQRQEARERAAPPDPPRRGSRQRRPPASSQVRCDSADGCDAPWADREMPARWTPCEASASSGAKGSRSGGSTPCCEEEPPDDELCHVAEVLVKFYGLPGGVDRGLILKNNCVIVQDDAWANRKRESQLIEPPMLWVRGGRVYDLLGDRGTVVEFGHDLLGRQVEDDDICRRRRREQGLMPYPFVPAPLKRNEDGDACLNWQADAVQDACGNGGRNGDRRKQPSNPAPFR